MSGVIVGKRARKQTGEEGKEGKSPVLRTSTWMIKDLKEFREEEGQGLTCSAEYFGDDVKVIEWRQKGNTEEASKAKHIEC